MVLNHLFACGVDATSSESFSDDLACSSLSLYSFVVFHGAWLFLLLYIIWFVIHGVSLLIRMKAGRPDLVWWDTINLSFSIMLGMLSDKNKMDSKKALQR